MQPVMPCETPSGPQATQQPTAASASPGTTGFLQVLLSLCAAAGESAAVAAAASVPAEAAQPTEPAGKQEKASRKTSVGDADSAVDTAAPPGAMNAVPLAVAVSTPVLPQIAAASPVDSSQQDAPKQSSLDTSEAKPSEAKPSKEAPASSLPLSVPEVLPPQSEEVVPGISTAPPQIPPSAKSQASVEPVAKVGTSPRIESASLPESTITKQSPTQSPLPESTITKQSPTQSADAVPPASAPAPQAATSHDAQSDNAKQERQKPNLVPPAQQRAIPSSDSNLQIQPDAKPAQAESPHRTVAQTGAQSPAEHKQQSDASPQSQPHHASADAAQPQPANTEPGTATARTSAAERAPDITPTPAHLANTTPAENASPRDSAASPHSADVPAQSASRPADPVTLVQNARLIQSVDTAEMRVAVNTPDLGRLEIHTMQHGDTVGAAIRVEHADTQRVMSAEAPSLERTLAQHHVELQGISLLDMHSGNNSRHANAWEPPSLPSRIPREESQATPDALSSAIPAAPVWSRSLNLLA